MTIDTEEITDLVRRQFNLILNGNTDVYSEYTVKVSSEQQIVEDLENHEIAIIVSLLPASIIFEQTALPIYIEAISEHNSANICQRLFFEYAETYNETGTTTRQIYNSPSMSSSFNEIYDGYRATYSLNGTFLINENSNKFDIKYGGEIVYSINNSLSFDTKINPTVSGDRTTSRNEYGTLSINMILPLSSNVAFANDLVKVMCGISNTDTEFVLEIVFASGSQLINTSFRVKNISIQQAIENLPILTASFTN